MIEIPFLVRIALILIGAVLVVFIFKKLKRKKTGNALKDLSALTALITKWERSGLLHWQVKGKTLLLEQSLAVSVMSLGPEKFKKFINLLAQLKNAELVGNAYEQQCERRRSRPRLSLPMLIYSASVRMHARICSTSI